ncbi:MAG TPA: adenosylcobinamide-phosphate synthase CbiB [Kofleriaceae bacterium]|nr:adenosylcobinamide-phosphate synthase CbiB [Kofleriaceae bacterium]
MAPSALAAALAVALAIDALLGEPPNAVHPVAWIGTLTSWVLRAAPRRPAAQLGFGALVALGIPALCAAVAAALVNAAAPWPAAQLAVAVALVKPSFALRALGEAGERVRRALAAGDVSGARTQLASLCSRDPAALEAPELAAAAIESLAENASDSVVAPLFYLAVLGVPGAIGYRAVNTLDAMIGYRGRYEYLGKAAARLDDVLNWIPARITAALVLAGAALTGRSAARGWRVLVRDGHRTASPNAGRPMAAMAGALAVTLEKPGHYRLGDGPPPSHAMIPVAWRIVVLASGLAAALAFLALGARHVWS